mmetsp:Transcript_73005/g.205054  ORF Transcript_73005/g.205054 Transcript_73005/m.205054 type:complete len:247 (+) Transcript_73005:127-867(+)
MGQQACTSVCSGASKGRGEHCVCGNSLSDDIVYCPKCGSKRPDRDLPPQVAMVAWIRRRSGPDCDFGSVFVDLFGSREAVSVRRFEEVLKEHGSHFDCKAAFSFLDRHAKSGRVGAADMELFQVEVDDHEVEALKHLRDFLKQNFKSPAAAFKEMGKGEGDVLTRSEFVSALSSLGFHAGDPHDLFNMVDKDFSGEVCFNEFKSVLRNVAKKQTGGQSGKDQGRSDKGSAGSPASPGGRKSQSRKN